jgi:ribokinase
LKKATVFGDINVDVLMSISSYPQPGGDATAAEVVLRPGGSAANTALALTKLGVKTNMIGRTGDDTWADIALEPLAKAGVDIHSVQRDPDKPTGLIFIPVTANGERTMFSYRGANLRISASDIEPQTLANSSILHLSGYNFLVSPQKEASYRAVELAQDMGIDLSMDIGTVPAARAKPELERILPLLNLVILGSEEAGDLLSSQTPEEAIPALLERGVSMVAFKLGQDGCIVADHTGTYRLPAFEVETVDTTGAGDAFCAGMLFARLHDLSLPAAGLLANALGGLATTVWGGGGDMPERGEVLNFLRTQENKCTEVGENKWVGEIISVLGRLN